MNFPSGFLLCRSALYLLCLLIALPVFADEINVPDDEETIQAAIDTATDGDTILVEPGEYRETITLRGKNGLTLSGRETARTILKPATSSKPVVTLDDTTDVTFKNFTILDASSGVSVINSTDFSISANVFHLGTSGIAVTISSNSEGDITNNTFYQNSIGAKRATTKTRIKNNLFVENETAISDSATSNSSITYNGFYSNTDDGSVGTNDVTLTNPSFVSVDQSDFHLQADSDADDKGSATDSSYDNSIADLGAYGGSDADTYPYPVGGLKVVNPLYDAASYSLTLQWTANTDYRVSGYKVYSYIEGVTSSYDITAGVTTSITSYPLASPTAPVSAAPTEIPAITAVTPHNQSLVVAWSAASGATRYELRYRADSTAEKELNVGNVTSYTLSGLTNGTTYKIRVLAVAQAMLHARVTAYNAKNESYTPSSEITQILGPAYDGVPSVEAEGMPEATVSYPLLPNEGCFIATAAYGHYSAPQVQALRDFRDRYLMKFSAGRAFVHWYYTHGPAGARVLNDYPVLKLPARIALYPLVLSALFFTQTLASIQLLAVLSLVLLSTIAVLRYRKRISCAGSARSP